MKMHFDVTLWTGKRTETIVQAYSTAVNPRTVTLKNGVKLTDKEIAVWLEKSLLEAVQKLESEARE